MTGEDTEAEAKGDYPARRTTTAALSAHTDGKCTSRHRTPRNAASEDRVAPSTRSSRMNAAEFRQLYPLPSKRFHALLNSLFKPGRKPKSTNNISDKNPIFSHG
jgi:hypothetical protein